MTPEAKELVERLAKTGREGQHIGPDIIKAWIDPKDATAAADLITQQDARIAELETELTKAWRVATDQRYMKEAYWHMLGPIGLKVADMWFKKGVLRVHHSWGPEATALTGEERAQVILDAEEAAKTAVPVEDIDSHLAARSVLGGKNG